MPHGLRDVMMFPTGFSSLKYCVTVQKVVSRNFFNISKSFVDFSYNAPKRRKLFYCMKFEKKVKLIGRGGETTNFLFLLEKICKF